jgi:hypothetical protein
MGTSDLVWVHVLSKGYGEQQSIERSADAQLLPDGYL